jgi:hypothetical protein
VAVVALATSGFAVVQVFRVGHSGAKAVWDETDEGGGEQEEGAGLGVGVAEVLFAGLASTLGAPARSGGRWVRRRPVGLTASSSGPPPS